jgi:Mce-associated membrane protein
VSDAKKEAQMRARRDHTLKVIKGAKPGVPGRSSQRRIVPRQLPRSVEPIEDLLKRLDQEPVEDPADAADPASGDDPASADSAPEDALIAHRTGEHATSTTRRRALVVLLVAVLAATVAAGVVTGHRWYVDRATDQARQQALAAGKQASVNFVSVSAASVDRDIQRITAGATGDFKDEFTRGQSQVRAAVVENKVDSRGTVLRAGLVSGDRRRAVVLVAVDATVKNVKAPEGRPSHYRIQLDIVHDKASGRWLVSRLQFVG